MFKLIRDKKSLRSFEISILHKAQDPGSILIPKRPIILPCLMAGTLSHSRGHNRTTSPVRDRDRGLQRARPTRDRDRDQDAPYQTIVVRRDADDLPFTPVLKILPLYKNQAKKLIYYKTLTNLRKRLANIIEDEEQFNRRVEHVQNTSMYLRKGSSLFDERSTALFGKTVSIRRREIDHVGYPIILLESTASRINSDTDITIYPTFAFLTLGQAASLVYNDKKKKPAALSSSTRELIEKVIRNDKSVARHVYSITDNMGSQFRTSPPRRRK